MIYFVSLKENSPLIYVSFNRKNPGSLFSGPSYGFYYVDRI